jgi:AcrR family transcriptional regulator
MSELEEKERIIEIAEQRFLRLGTSKVTLDEIAAELRMSKKTMYKFFPSKEDLLRTIVHAIMGRLRGRVEAIVESDKPFVQKAPELLAVLGRQIGMISKQFMIDLQRFAPALWKEMDDFRRERILTNVRRMFTQAKEEGVFRKDLDVELFILVFLNSVQGIVNPQTLTQQSFSGEEALAGIFKIIFEGAMTEEARKEFGLFDEATTTLSPKGSIS